MSAVEQVLQASLTAQPFLVTGRLLDRIPEVENPLGAGFSIRRLYTRYRGPLVRVRRSSDNSERDIGVVQTELDRDQLESFCAGFDGYVSVWYDQTGNERHARQPDFSLQPQIVASGAILRDSFNNYTIRFNGAYLTTEWEPEESELKDGTAMLAVLTPSTGVQGQSGSVQAYELDPPISVDDYPEYPFDKLPLGTDIHNLDATFVSGALQNVRPEPQPLLFRPRSVTMYVGADKRVRTIDVADRSVSELEARDTDTNAIEPVSAIGGPSVLQADVIEYPNQGTSATETQWWRGIVGLDGRVYGIPYDAQTVLVIDPEPEVPNERASFLSFPDGSVAAQKEKYRAAALHDNGWIYCAPWNATRILAINTNPGVDDGDRVVFFDESYNITPSEPAFSSIVYVPPKLYCVPFGASQVMILNPNAPDPPEGSDEARNVRYAGDVERSLPDGTPEIETAALLGSGKFTDGTVVEDEIVGVPGSAGTFLRVIPDPDPNTTNDRVTVFGTTGTDGRISNSGNGYWYRSDVPDANVPLRFEDSFTKRTADRANASVRVSPTRVVTSFNVNEGGTGYVGTPSFNIGSGSVRIRGASITNVQMEDVFDDSTDPPTYLGRRVASIDVGNCGEGYSGGVGFGVSSGRSGKGSDAILRADVDFSSTARSIIIVDVERGGSGYFFRDSVSISISSPPSGGGRATARVLEWTLANENDDPEKPVNGYAIQSVEITNPGFGYTTRPSVTVSGGKGSTASVSASTAVDGHVRRIDVPVGGIGSGFQVDQSPSPVVIDPPLNGGIQATARVSQVGSNGEILAIEVTDGGQGYVSTPSAKIAGFESESEGLLVTYRNHGRLTAFAMTEQGFGYTRPPSVTIDPDGAFSRPGNNRTGSIQTRLEPPGTPDEALSEDRWSEIHANPSRTIAYGVPYNTWRTVRIQRVDGTLAATLSDGEDLTFEPGEINYSEAKWARGVVSNDRLWCIPFSDNRVLALDYADTGALNVAFYGNLRGQWNSATVGTRGGVIYAFPAAGDSVLVLDPRQPTRIETLRYGNLRGTGARFSDGVTISPDKNAGFGGIMYAIPDRSTVIAEINPGVPLRSVDLPPPHVLLYDATGEDDTNNRSLVAFAPTLENPFVRIVDFRNLEDVRTFLIPVDKHPNDSSIPWFAEGVALEEPAWPDGHVSGQTGAVRAAFLPYWNSNSDFGYEGRIGVLTVHLEPNVTPSEDPTVPSTVDTDFPLVTGASWSWTTTQVDIEYACPFPSRSAVCLGPNLGSGRRIAWVPRESQQAMVTFDFGESPEVGVEIGTGASVQSALRTQAFVDWSSAQVDRDNGIVALATPALSSATEISTVDARGDRLRYCAGIFTNGRVVCMPARRGRMVVREIDPTQTSPWNPITFELNVRSLLESVTRLSDYWNFAGAVHVPSLNLIYAIPYRYEGVLEYNTVEQIASTFGNEVFRETVRGTKLSGRTWRNDDDNRYYWGGVFDGRYVWCIPYNTRIVLRIDPFEPNLTRRFDTTLSTPSSSRTYAGYRTAIVANDRIYFVPFRARRILELDPTNPLGATIQEIGPDLGGGDKWNHAVIAPNGKVYGIPWRSAHVLELTPRSGSNAPTTRLIAHGQRGIWSAGRFGVDGNLYMVPYRARGVLVFDPRTEQRFVMGRFDTRGRDERNEQWIDCVSLPSNEIFGIPASRRLGLRVFPEGVRIGTMDFRNQGRTFRTSALVQREFRSRPERFVSRTRSGANQTYVVFHGDEGYAIHAFDASQNVGRLAFGPRYENGLTALVLDRTREGLPMLTAYVRDYAFETTFFIGGVAGLLTEEGTNDYAMVVERGTYRFSLGTGTNRVINLFDVIFGEGTAGVVATFAYRRGSQGVLETFLRGVPVNLTNYAYSGNASGGATVQIGRVERAFQIDPESRIPTFLTQYTGDISELVLFASDQRELGVELGRLQTNAYNAF